MIKIDQGTECETQSKLLSLWNWLVLLFSLICIVLLHELHILLKTFSVCLEANLAKCLISFAYNNHMKIVYGIIIQLNLVAAAFSQFSIIQLNAISYVYQGSMTDFTSPCCEGNRFASMLSLCNHSIEGKKRTIFLIKRCTLATLATTVADLVCFIPSIKQYILC